MITRRHYFCDMYILFINRIKRALLQKEKKKRKKISLLVFSLFLSRNAAFALCALLCLSPSTVQAPSRINGGSEMTKRKERKKEKREKKDAFLNPKKLFKTLK